MRRPPMSRDSLEIQPKLVRSKSNPAAPFGNRGMEVECLAQEAKLEIGCLLDEPQTNRITIDNAFLGFERGDDSEDQRGDGEPQSEKEPDANKGQSETNQAADEDCDLEVQGLLALVIDKGRRVLFQAPQNPCDNRIH